jgi:hypothetical protein
MNKAEKRVQSTLALKELLITVINEPSKSQANAKLKEALKVQSKLAKWEDEALGITQCSLNTLKNSAENVIDGGYRFIDNLRLNALLAIEQHSERKKSSNKTSKAGLSKRVSELEHSNRVLEQQNKMLVDLLVNLKGKALEFANDGSDITKTLCKREMSRLSAKVGFTGNMDLITAIEKDADKISFKNVSDINGNSSDS